MLADFREFLKIALQTVWTGCLQWIQKRDSSKYKQKVSTMNTMFLRGKHLWPNWGEKPRSTLVGFSQHFTTRAKHVTMVTTLLQSSTHVTVYPKTSYTISKVSLDLDTLTSHWWKEKMKWTPHFKYFSISGCKVQISAWYANRKDSTFHSLWTVLFMKI